LIYLFVLLLVFVDLFSNEYSLLNIFYSFVGGLFGVCLLADDAWSFVPTSGATSSTFGGSVNASYFVVFNAMKGVDDGLSGPDESF
jgi:hypothetical protein